jgi:hypothetical protein
MDETAIVSAERLKIRVLVVVMDYPRLCARVFDLDMSGEGGVLVFRGRAVPLYCRAVRSHGRP